MSILQSPKIVTDGLVFYYDMNNGKSFVGAPVTNTLPTPSLNGLPTTGNGWGTYNTNQYNNNTYFSIGSISSVSSNIVTTSGNHPLRSYDVVTPQTTGGGVTAGTNYLVKKLSNTTFSLHSYNSSQDGSQGFINPATGNHKVYDDFANDVRISVNATSFPTMWWGPPHLPNSALVKEIISQGFTGIPGRPPTDCIRLHHNRTDTTDGMAYGPDAAVVAGTPYTVSFWARSVSPSAVGTTGSYQIYNYGATTPSGYSVGYTLGPVGEWRKYTLTFTPNNPLAISYWFPGTGGIKYDLANIQFEAGSVANNFVAGSRSSTEVLRDITGNYILTPTNLSYSSSGTFSFSGSSYIDLNSSNIITGNNAFTVEAWYTTTGTTADEIFGNYGSASTSNTLWISGRYGVYINSAVYFPGAPIGAGTYHMVVTRNESGNTILYRNGVQMNSGSLPASIAVTYNFRIGADVNGAAEPFTGSIHSVKVYNKVLTVDEIQQNFNTHRGRYGL